MISPPGPGSHNGRRSVDQQDAPHRRAPPLVDHRRRRVVKAVVEQAGQRVATKRRVTAPEVHKPPTGRIITLLLWFFFVNIFFIVCISFATATV